MSISFSYGTTNIKYEVKRSDRKTLAIEVHPDTSVLVIAPINATIEDIQSKVERKAQWIAKQQRFFSNKPVSFSKPEWVNGENIFYLGRQYRLNLLEGEPNVKLSGKYLQVTVLNKSDKIKIEGLIEKWYLSHARLKISERLKNLNPIFQKEGLEMNKLIIRKLNKRWGSCTLKGNIVINADLIKFPTLCLDYVLIHEICHLKHHNHGPEFWGMLTKYCPEWVKWKDRLEKFQI